MEENKRISDLFDRARTEAPKISVDKTKRHFLAASAVGGASIIAKWAASSFKFKAIVMIASLSTLTISGILIATQFGSSAQAVEVKADEIWESTSQNIEISNENGIQKTTVFDENNKVLEVLIDSSNKRKVDPTINLSTKEPQIIQNSKKPSTASVLIDRPEYETLKESDSLKTIKFIITENTTSEKLKAISNLASTAGIEFNYNARVRKQKIKRIRVKMELIGKNYLWQSTISGSKSFSLELGWLADTNGKAVRFVSCENDFLKFTDVPELPEVKEITD